MWIEFNPELVVPLFCFVRNQNKEAASPKAVASASTPEGHTITPTPEVDVAGPTPEVDPPKEQKEQATSSPLGNLFKRMGNFFKTR